MIRRLVAALLAGLAGHRSSDDQNGQTVTVAHLPERKAKPVIVRTGRKRRTPENITRARYRRSRRKSLKIARSNKSIARFRKRAYC